MLFFGGFMKKIFVTVFMIVGIFCGIVGLTACYKNTLLQFTLSGDASYYICEYGYMWAEEKEIVIPFVYNDKPVEEIGAFHFMNLESVVIPSSVKRIGEEAFSGCEKLKNVSIGSGVTTIGALAFLGCPSLESIVIPDNVTTIEENAFESCVNLKSVTLGRGITSIQGYTFRFCENLKNIVLPNTIEAIEDNAFDNCGLESITIGSGVTTIGEYAFRECNHLTSVILPDGLVSIGGGAFFNCRSLKNVVLNGREKITIGDSVFDGCSNFQYIYANCTPIRWIEIENSSPIAIAFYSETAPKDDAYNYWHYVDGEIVIWN